MAPIVPFEENVRTSLLLARSRQSMLQLISSKRNVMRCNRLQYCLQIGARRWVSSPFSQYGESLSQFAVRERLVTAGTSRGSSRHSVLVNGRHHTRQRGLLLLSISPSCVPVVQYLPSIDWHGPFRRRRYTSSEMRSLVQHTNPLFAKPSRVRIPRFMRRGSWIFELHKVRTVTQGARYCCLGRIHEWLPKLGISHRVLMSTRPPALDTWDMDIGTEGSQQAPSCKAPLVLRSGATVDEAHIT